LLYSKGYQHWFEVTDEKAKTLVEEFDGRTTGRFEKATCEFIQYLTVDQKKRSLVFFGDEGMLKAEGVYSHLTELAATDRLTNKVEPINFIKNNDPACKEQAGLDMSKTQLVFFD